jgi:hypothetical protein
VSGVAAIGVAALAAWVVVVQTDGAHRATLSNVAAREAPSRSPSVAVPLDKVKVLNAGALAASSEPQAPSDISDVIEAMPAEEDTSPSASMGFEPPARPKAGKLAPQSTPPETYRTVCVRLCDGGYFSLSFATTPAHFDEDAAVCQMSCGTPVRLYVYRNPGARPDYMHDLNGNAYAELVNAFRFRSAYDPACTCRPQPWTMAAQQRHREYALQEAGEPEPARTAAELAARSPHAEDVEETEGPAADGAADGTAGTQPDSAQAQPPEPRARKRAARPPPASLAAAIEDREPAPKARRREAASRRFDGTDWRITPYQPF